MKNQPGTRLGGRKHVGPSKSRRDGKPSTKRKQKDYDELHVELPVRPLRADGRNPRLVEVGKRIFMARTQLQALHGFAVSQAMIANALKLYPHSVGRFEAGIREASGDTIIALAAVLRTTPCYLMFGCDHPMKPASAPPLVRGASGMQLLDKPLHIRRRKGSKSHH